MMSELERLNLAFRGLSDEEDEDGGTAIDGTDAEEEDAEEDDAEETFEE